MSPIDVGAAVATVSRTLDAAIDAAPAGARARPDGGGDGGSDHRDGVRVGPEAAGVRQRRERGRRPASGRRAGRPVSDGTGGIAAIALTADTSLLTSVANDYGFARVFARQVEALGVAGDVAFAISTSGASPNVIAALESARARGLRTIALTGRDGGEAGRLADVHVNVPDDCTARVQEVHITLIHAICEIVETGVTSGN